MKISYFLVDFASPLYDVSIQLRTKVLREPLGLSFTTEDLSKEWNQKHLVGVNENGDLVAVLVLKQVDNKVVKMRQVAVDPSLQGKGIGKMLVEHSEGLARQMGFEKMELSAREVAVDFYLKLGYKKVGKKFEEVGIPHFKMTKVM